MDDEKVKDTGLMHDDDGNVDDKRVAGWILVVFALLMGIADLLPFFTANERIVESFLFAGGLLLGATLTEKFKRP